MKTIALTVAACLSLAINAFAAGADTITFDEFSYSVFNPYSLLTNGYHGLNWNNMYAFNPFVYQYPSDYPQGVISLYNCAFNGSAQPATITISSGQFDLDSAYLTAHDANPLLLHVQAFTGATLRYANDYFLYPGNPQNINFNYAGIDRVTFTPNWYGQTYGANFILDNLVVTIPEPGICWLLSLGSVALTSRSRRRGRPRRLF